MRTNAGRAAWILLAALIGFLPATDLHAKRKKKKASAEETSAPVRIAPLDDLGEEPPEDLGEEKPPPPPVDAPAATEPVDPPQDNGDDIEADATQAPPLDEETVGESSEPEPVDSESVDSESVDSESVDSQDDAPVDFDEEEMAAKEASPSRKERRAAKKAEKNAPNLGDEEGSIHTPPPPPVDPDAPVYVRSSDGIAYAISQLMPSFESCLAAAESERQASNARLRVHFEISREGTIGPVKVIGSSGGDIEGCLVLSVATLRFEKGPIEQPVQIPIQVRISG